MKITARVAEKRRKLCASNLYPSFFKSFLIFLSLSIRFKTSKSFTQQFLYKILNAKNINKQKILQ